MTPNKKPIALIEKAGPDRTGLRTWIEVDKNALEQNFRLFRGLIPSTCRLMAICKSNAYGYGLYDLAPALEKMGVDWIGVDSIVEAVTLREKGIRKPLLVLGYTLPSRFAEAAGHDVSLTISNFESLRALASFRQSSKIKIHLKLDTGMYRQGFLPSQTDSLLRFLKKNKSNLSVEGLYTHFAASKDPKQRDYTRRQIQEFSQAFARFEAAGFYPIRHASATAGVLNYPEANYDLVRIGIGLMGYWPSSETRKAWEKYLTLKPALSWRTIISEIKKAPKGARISYDLTETLSRNSTIGVCPVGYWHGYFRSLSKVGEVLVRGHRVKVLGAISMDMTVVDLTDVPAARVGDVVTVIGRDGKDEITAYEVAAKAKVSHYELLTRINPLIQKFYLD
jgi:alanine racemase